MKTLRTLSDRNLEKLKARILGKIWNGFPAQSIYYRHGLFLMKIGEEEIRRRGEHIKRILP